MKEVNDFWVWLMGADGGGLRNDEGSGVQRRMDGERNLKEDNDAVHGGNAYLQKRQEEKLSGREKTVLAKA